MNANVLLASWHSFKACASSRRPSPCPWRSSVTPSHARTATGNSRRGRLFGQVYGQITEIHLAGCQREVPRDDSGFIEHNLGHGKPFGLMLQGLGRQPVVDLLLTALE